MNINPLWFVNGPVPDEHDTVDTEDWLRQQASQDRMWVVDQRILDPMDEPVEHLLGIVPSLVLDPLADNGVQLPDSLLQLGPERSRPAVDITASGTFLTLRIGEVPALAVAWIRDGYTLFGTWWQGWIVGGLLPTDGEQALHLHDSPRSSASERPGRT